MTEKLLIEALARCGYYIILLQGVMKQWFMFVRKCKLSISRKEMAVQRQGDPKSVRKHFFTMISLESEKGQEMPDVLKLPFIVSKGKGEANMRIPMYTIR